jgi:large subunit ribosomal protein L10
MKKIGIIIKEYLEKDLQERIKTSSGFFVIKYSGLSGPDLSCLRQVMRDCGARFLVVKNSIARRALKACNLDISAQALEGPCGFVFATDALVETAKAIYNFAKEHEQLKYEAGFVENRLVSKNEIEGLAKLPSKELLRAQLVGGLNAIILRLVWVLNGNLRKLVLCLEQIKNKKSSSG